MNDKPRWVRILDRTWPFFLLVLFWVGVLVTGAPAELAALAMPAFIYVIWVENSRR